MRKKGINGALEITGRQDEMKNAWKASHEAFQATTKGFGLSIEILSVYLILSFQPQGQKWLLLPFLAQCIRLTLSYNVWYGV
jgi:hypothetical protein